MDNEMKKEMNREIRAFNKTITPSTTNKEIWDKKVELCKKYGLKIVGYYQKEKQTKYIKLGTITKGFDDSIYINVEPKAIKLSSASIVEIEL